MDPCWIRLKRACGALEFQEELPITIRNKARAHRQLMSKNRPTTVSPSLSFQLGIDVPTFNSCRRLCLGHNLSQPMNHLAGGLRVALGDGLGFAAGDDSLALAGAAPPQRPQMRSGEAQGSTSSCAACGSAAGGASSLDEAPDHEPSPPKAVNRTTEYSDAAPW